MQVTTGSHYLAFVLDEETRQAIFKLYPARHEVQVCHHITIQFKIKDTDVARLQELVDSNPRFELAGLVESETIDFFYIDVNGEPLITDRRSHLTFSRKPEAQNRDSNRVMKGELGLHSLRFAAGTLTGHFALLPY